MGKKIEIEPTGGDGASANFITECFVRAWRNLLHQNRYVRKNAIAGLIKSGNKPQVLNVFMNRSGLETSITPEDLAELGRVAGLPTDMEFRFEDHTRDDG